MVMLSVNPDFQNCLPSGGAAQGAISAGGCTRLADLVFDPTSAC